MQQQPPQKGRIFLWLIAVYLVGVAGLLVWQGSHWTGTLGASVLDMLQSVDATTGSGTLTGDGIITHVRDGDTIEVSLKGANMPVRLIGVDTPETVKPRTPVQCYGPEASAFTKTFAGQHVTLEQDPTQDAYDVYGRMLAYVYLDDGRELNTLLVQQGFAREYTYQKPYLHQAAYRQLQAEAKKEGLGLWAACTQ